MIDQLAGKDATVILSCIAVLMALQLLKGVGEFVYDIFKKKSDLTETTIKELTLSVQRLDHSIEKLNEKTEVFPKLNRDLIFAFKVIKELAGEEKWRELRDRFSDRTMQN